MAKSTLSAKISNCTISLGLDKRHSKSNLYPVCIRYSFNGKFMYYPIGDQCTEKEFKQIIETESTRGRSSESRKSNANIKKKWEEVFETYRERLEKLAATSFLTPESVHISLTGKSSSQSFITVWEEIINDRKAGTAASYEGAKKSFIKCTGFSEADGFMVTKDIIHKWVQTMTDENKSKATIGIYLRSCRVVVKECISRGFISQSEYPFSDRDTEKVSIPKGKSRRQECLSVEQMTELYEIFTKKDYPESWGKVYNKGLHISLGLFLFQYLGNGMNLADVARITYNTHYIQNNEKSLLFNRKKTKDRTDDDSEVIVPVIPALKRIMDEIAEPYEKDERLFPFILKGATTEEDCRVRIAQENQNIRKRMAKLTKHLGWKVSPSPTWCRHSFATNLAHQGVPMQYISDAMGHKAGKSVTMLYINMYPHEKQMEYNGLLLNIPSNKKQKSDLDSILKSLSEADKKKLIKMILSESE